MKIKIDGLKSLIFTWALTLIPLAPTTRIDAVPLSGTIVFNGDPRTITLKLSPESPSRHGFTGGDSVRKTLAIFEMTHASVLPITVNQFIVKKSPGVGEVYIEVDDALYLTSPFSFANGETLWAARIEKTIDFAKAAKVSVLGTIQATSDYTDAWIEFSGVTSNANFITVVGPNPARHAVVDGFTKEDIPNVSVRAFVAPSSSATLGFVVRGEKNKGYPVLLRAIGPTLSKFGVKDTLEDPLLKLYGSDHRLISENDNWLDWMNVLFQMTGAFALPDSSYDSAIFAYLLPGTYTIEVKGFGTGTGNVLLEVYTVPEPAVGKG